jgi:transketolase
MNGARFAYLNRFCEIASQNRNFMVVSADYAAPMFDAFKRDFSEQYISVGIAEQNMIAVACGLALMNKRVIAYGLSPFPVTRAFDQIKSAVTNMGLPISIVVSGVGLSEQGITHSNIDDVALMRTLPNMRIITPTDNIMGAAVADYALVNTDPLYVRFDKNADGDLYAGRTIDFERGFEVLHNGKDAVLITCGYFTRKLLELAERLEPNGVKAKVIDLYALPFDTDTLISEIGGMPVVTIEEHIINGGIGSVMLELLNERGLPNKVKRMGIDFGGAYPRTSGTREYYIEKYGLGDHDLMKQIIELLLSLV